MVNKIQELTEKLYTEGLQKGKAESQLMIENAEQQSKEIVKEAQKKAAEILAEAEKSAKELSENTFKEVSLASNQALADLRQASKELFVNAAINAPVSQAFNNDNFIQELILSVINEWASKGSINASIQIPEDKKQMLNDYLLANAKENLNKGLSLEGMAGIKNGFRIAQENGRYHINFTDKEFNAFFSLYIRPRIVSILFGKE